MRYLIIAFATLSVVTPASAQTLITVGDGQTLTQQDLTDGIFDGQPFTLSPDTTFEIESGGSIGPLGRFGSFPSFNNEIIDFQGATAKLLDGAIASSSFVENLNLVMVGGLFAPNSRVQVQGDSRLEVRGSYGPGNVRVGSDVVVDMYSSFKPGGYLQVAQTTEMNLFVSEIQIDGIAQPLEPGETFSSQRTEDTVYQATFLDGTVWVFETRDPFPTGSRDRIPDGTRINARRPIGVVPEPTAGMLLVIGCGVVIPCRRGRGPTEFSSP